MVSAPNPLLRLGNSPNRPPQVLLLVQFPAPSRRILSAPLRQLPTHSVEDSRAAFHQLRLVLQVITHFSLYTPLLFSSHWGNKQNQPTNRSSTHSSSFSFRFAFIYYYYYSPGGFAFGQPTTTSAPTSTGMHIYLYLIYSFRNSLYLFLGG